MLIFLSYDKNKLNTYLSFLLISKFVKLAFNFVVNFFLRFIGIDLQNESAIFLEFLNDWDCFLFVSFSFSFDRLWIIVVSAWCFSSFGESLKGSSFTAVKKEQITQFDINSNFFVPFNQVVFISWETINYENSLPVLFFDFLFHQLNNDLSWYKFTEFHWFFNEFFMSSVFFHLFSQ